MEVPAVVTGGPGRVILAKLGMDAHWRGIGVVARLLRDAGYEVIYLGHATPAALVAVVEAEDVDVIGVSSLSGNHMTEVARLLAELERAGLADIPLVVGGTISKGEATLLRDRGVAAVFGPDTPADDITTCFAALTRADA